ADIIIGAVLLACWAGQAGATSTVKLPDWVCAHPDAIFIDGFQPVAGITRLPSNGSGGATGSISRVVNVPGYGNHTIHLRVPPSYSASRPLPLLLVLHGQAGSQSGSNTAAQAVLDAWAPIADANGFIVIAPVATGPVGDWLPPPPNPSDYSIFPAAIAEPDAAFNNDTPRRIG